MHNVIVEARRNGDVGDNNRLFYDVHAPLSPVGRAANHFRERQPEFGAEHGVYDRVQGGVEVAQPQEEAGHVLVDDAAGAQGHDQGHDEERQPAHDERAGDDGQRLGGLPLAFRLQRFLLLAFGLDARRRRHGRHRGHHHPVVHVHLDHRVPAGRRRVRDRGPVVLDHRNWRLQLVVVVLVLVLLVVRRRGSVLVVRCDRERGGLVVVLCAAAAAAAASATAVSHFGLTAAAAVLRRLGHGTARMAVDQSDARAYGCLFYFFLFLNPQEHGLSEEAAFLGFCLGGCIVRRLFQPVTHANKPAGVAFSDN